MDLWENPQDLTIQGERIRYYSQGKGEVVLFVHGITTYSFIWRKVIPFFIPRYKVIALDLLGCGDSSKPLKKDLSLKAQASLLHLFLQTLEINKIHLVCHDVGGGVGQILATQFPDSVKDLCLVNSVAFDFWPVQPIVAMKTPIIRQIAMAALDFGMLELIVKRGLHNKKNLDQELINLFSKPLKSPLGRKAFLHFARCLDNNDLMEIAGELKLLPIPTLIIRGNQDVYLDRSIAEKLHETLPQSQLICIERAGHFIQEDEGELLAQKILSFFGRKDE